MHLLFLKKTLNEPVQAHGLFFMLKYTVSSYNLEAVFYFIIRRLFVAKEYNLKVITQFNNTGESLEDIIIKILNNNIFSDAQIDFQSTTIYNEYK